MTPEQAKFAATLYLSGVENEFPITMKVLAAVPEAKKGYKPDEHARTAAELAAHLASSDFWFLNGVVNGDFTPQPDKTFGSIAEIVKYYEHEIPAAIAKIKAMPAEKLAQPVAFFGAFNYPVVLYLGFANHHSVHHRAQLSTYLRPMGAKVPSIYGGSYDEPFQAPAAAGH
ncbi:MAG TPA: DinB family protein [Candidatus Acidoferrales bacterium]|nr:DinB family protein [Candidatus Acidoferrales bacterium]